MPAGPDGQAGSVPFDITIAHSSRVYDYWLGGKDHFAADREAAELALKAYPGIAVAARANRAFLARVVRYLAAEAGIRQFLDIGSGIPTARNTHEVAQSAAAECRVVYVDHDPVVLAHSRALLNSHPAGATDYIQADLLDPGDILGQAAKTLDFSRPVALLLMSVVHLIPDEAAPHAIIGRLTGAVAPGSFLAISHGTGDLDARVVAMSADLTGVLVEPVTARTRDQVARFFDGLELVEPGLVPIPQWRPASSEEAAVKASLWGGVARKPALSAH